MCNVNEILKDGVNEFVDYVLENGMTLVFSNLEGEEIHREVIEKTFLNGKSITLYDFMKILINNDIKSLMSIEVKEFDDDDTEVRFTMDLAFRVICQQYGLKYDNVVIRKILRMFQRRMSEMFITDSFEVVDNEEDIPTTDEELDNVYDSLHEINRMYIDLCDMTDTNWDELSIYTVRNWDRQMNDIVLQAKGIKGMKGICLHEMQIELFEEKVMDIYDGLTDDLLDGKFGEKIIEE